MKRLLGYKGRCQFLHSEGNRCKKLATIRDSYHGEEFIHNGTWVEIDVCDEHAKVIQDDPLTDLPCIIFPTKRRLTKRAADGAKSAPKKSSSKAVKRVKSPRR